MGEALEALVRTLEGCLESRTALEPEVLVVLADEAAKLAVGVLHRLDQAENAPALGVDGDVLETFGQARGAEQPVALPGLEREVDAGHQIEIVENHERSGVIDERDAAGLEPTALLRAWEQFVKLLLPEQF